MKFNKIMTAGLVTLTLIVSGCQNDTANQDTQNSSAQPASADAAVAQNSTPLRAGSPAPNFTGVDSNGKKHQLSDFKGKVVVLEWTNHECPFVKKHYETNNMQKIQQQTTGKGAVWLSIVSSAPGQQGHVTAQKANELTKSRKAKPTAVILDADGKIGRFYNARTTPHMYVLGKDGTLQYTGAIDNNPSKNPQDVASAKNYVTAAVDSILKGQPVGTATTQPYGCSVKYGT